MKKLLLATLLAASFGVAQAADGLNFGKIELENNSFDGGGASNQFNVQLGRNIGSGFAIDGKAEMIRSNETATLGDRLEAGLTYTPFTGISVRGAVGEKFSGGVDGTSNHAYYSIEPGIKIPANKLGLPVSDKLTLVSKYRFRDAFDAQDQQQHRVKVGAEYAITNDQYVDVSFARTWDNDHFNTAQVGYGFKF